MPEDYSDDIDLPPAYLQWEDPFCGMIYSHEKVAGDPVICDRDIHSPDVKHLNTALGFEWW